MTATVGSTPQHGPASSPPVPSATAEQSHWRSERQQQLLLALTTEHFTLQTARSATIADSNGRSALYLATVSSAVVALAFIGQLPHTARRSSCSRWRCCRGSCCWARWPWRTPCGPSPVRPCRSCTASANGW